MWDRLTDKSPLEGVAPEYAHLQHQVWREIASRKNIGGFLPTEFESPEKMDVAFLRLLYKARLMAGVPFRIIDTTRGDPRSAHGELPCAAVDLQLLNSYERSRTLRALYAVGFVRVGIYPGTSGEYKGQVKKDGGGLHVDASRDKPQDRCWTMGLPKKDE